MEDHFDRIFATDGSGSGGDSLDKKRRGDEGAGRGKGGDYQQYIRAQKFQGKKSGYIFQMGPHGLGYYFDHYQFSSSSTSLSEKDQQSDMVKKRKLDHLSTASSSSSFNVEKILEESEQNDIEILNPVTLTKLLLSFEKKINKNQAMRMKHPDQPETFLDSEIELHKEINNLYAVSASPELYPVVVESGSVPSILGMIAHDNTDISIAAIGLLLELTDPDTVLESDDAEVLIDSLLENQALELIVQNLFRLDENQDSDAQGVHDSLEIIENLVEIRPTLAETVCEKTHLLRYLFNRLISKSFDDNKLYCSEILSILLQTGHQNVKRLHALVPDSADDGIEMLLQAIFPYRKRDPKSSEEKEFIQNLFLCLCTALMDPENQIRFREKEGFELMEKCLKENKIAAGSAVRVLSYAILNNRQNCLQLLQVNGFKYLFPFFMGRGVPSGIDKVGKREIEESAISIISQLCLQLHGVTEASASSRLLKKLTENQLEKTERCIELFAKYSRVLSNTESEIDSLIRTLSNRVSRGDQEAEMELQLLDSDEARYLKRLDGGLHTLQQLTIILTFVCVSMNQDRAIIRRLHSKLGSTVQFSFLEIQNILRELAASIEVEEGSGEEEKTDDEIVELVRRKAQRQLLIEWSACLAAIESEFNE